MYIMVYCHRTDKRKRPISVIEPTPPTGINIREAKQRVRISASRRYRYYPSEEYLAFINKFKKQIPIIGY